MLNSGRHGIEDPASADIVFDPQPGQTEPAIPAVEYRPTPNLDAEAGDIAADDHIKNTVCRLCVRATMFVARFSRLEVHQHLEDR